MVTLLLTQIFLDIITFRKVGCDLFTGFIHGMHGEPRKAEIIWTLGSGGQRNGRLSA
jgi:hypothetical protein